jgi:hypothetical protein
MNKHIIDSSYRQFYVADAGLDPDAPEDWEGIHIQQRFNALQNIVALCPEGDIMARICCFPPGQKYVESLEPGFVVHTQIKIETGRLGVFGWPREPLEEYSVEPGIYKIKFCGYGLDEVQSEGDFYVVEFEKA